MKDPAPKRNTANALTAMTPAEIDEFLAGRQEARLATLRSDDQIQLTPVWYVYEDGQAKFCLERDRRHLANLRRRPSATLLVDEDRRPAEGWLAPVRGVMLAGSVVIVDDQDQTEVAREQILRRYLGDEARTRGLVGPDKDPRLSFVLVMLTSAQTLAWDFTKQRQRAD